MTARSRADDRSVIATAIARHVTICARVCFVYAIYGLSKISHNDSHFLCTVAFRLTHTIHSVHQVGESSQASSLGLNSASKKPSKIHPTVQDVLAHGEAFAEAAEDSTASQATMVIRSAHNDGSGIDRGRKSYSPKVVRSFGINRVEVRSAVCASLARLGSYIAIVRYAYGAIRTLRTLSLQTAYHRTLQQDGATSSLTQTISQLLTQHMNMYILNSAMFKLCTISMPSSKGAHQMPRGLHATVG
jgi:hypothetical protein